MYTGGDSIFRILMRLLHSDEERKKIPILAFQSEKITYWQKITQKNPKKNFAIIMGLPIIGLVLYFLTFSHYEKAGLY